MAIHLELEKLTSRFVGKEASMIVGMGFATNSWTIPALMGPQGGKGVLILSDSLNHASIVEGVKQCGATVKPFAHNDMPDLQRMLHTATTKGQAAFAKEKASPRKRQEEPLSRLLPRPRLPPSSPGARSSLLSRASTAWRASSATCPRSWR